MEDLAQESSPLCGGANGVAENWTRERHDASLNPDGAAVNYTYRSMLAHARRYVCIHCSSVYFVCAQKAWFPSHAHNRNDTSVVRPS